jgi:hypothetical protein
MHEVNLDMPQAHFVSSSNFLAASPVARSVRSSRAAHVCGA